MIESPTERRHPFWDASPSPTIRALLHEMLDLESATSSALQGELPRVAAAASATTRCLEGGGSLIYIGAGSSGRLGVLDAAECPPTFHTPPNLVRAVIAGGDRALRQAVEGAEDDREAGVRDLVAAGVTPADAVVGISASGRTPYVVAALDFARNLGATTACVVCSADSELARIVQFPIEAVVGPEIIAGSTRLRAGTATKLILNMLSTATMVALGYTYRGLMVNVQPTNSKLEDRARRIIQELARVTPERAAALLELAGRSVPVAIVMERRKVERKEAERLLAQARGRLSVVLEGTT